MNDDLFTFQIRIHVLYSVSCLKRQTDGSDNEDLDVYERKVCYDECEKMNAKAVIFINKKLVRLINVTMKQWLRLKYGDQSMTSDEVNESVIGTWLVRSYKKQFEEYIELKKQWEALGLYIDVLRDPSNAKFSNCDEWEDFDHANHIGVDADSNYNPYLDVSRIFNDNVGKNNCNETLDNKGWIDELQLMKDDNDDIGNLEDYLTHKVTPYYFNKEEEKFKKRRCKLHEIPYVKLPTCKSKKFKVVKYSFGPAEEYVAIKEYEYDILVRTEENVSHVYQDIFHKKDKGWSVTCTK
nr:zf-BED domain-containing protein [Tanacetum cinerariifolium]